MPSETQNQQLAAMWPQIEHAAALLRQGKLVAFPTETVYGLGAHALDPEAVARIFAAKGRPHTSPLIVHVNSLRMARDLAAEWPERAALLANRFWPGPLTVVVKKNTVVPDIVSAGLTTVGLRMPAHPVALALLQEAHIPVAAPSANRFTQLSPTTAEHVRQGLGTRVDYILDGGPSSVGIESTVLSVVDDTPVLLRPGGISRAEIESIIGPIATASAKPDGAAHPSPGMHPQHYSPRTPLYLVRGGQVPEQGIGAYVQLHTPPRRSTTVVVMAPDPHEYAARLYAILHELDQGGYDWIAVEAPEDNPLWEAVLDRLRRASAQ
jgi:L-threonylcarbamoyladenylate synthase